MMPAVPYTKNHYYSSMVPMLGLNLSNNFTDGELRESRNVSSRNYPHLTTRRARVKMARQGVYYTGAVAMSATDVLIVAEASTQGGVDGYQLYNNGLPVTNGFVTTKPNQFVPINTKIVLWPNKQYIDNNVLKNMEASVNTAHAFFSDEYTVRLTNDMNEFAVGDSVELVGTGTSAGKDRSFVIKELYTDTIEGTTYFIVKATSAAFTDLVNEDLPFYFNRNVPDMAYICCANNRLFGCSLDGSTIYASGLGLQNTWNDFSGLSTDSYAVAVATPGIFTGCIPLGSSVLFFKEKNLHKLSGMFPAQYSVYTYEFEGLRYGCEKSMCVINEVLYYVGLHGVYVYTGGTPQLISSRLGELDITEAVAGNDGDSYYLSAKVDGVQKFLCYEARYGLWQHEDDLKVIDFARIGRSLYFLDTSGFVWLEDNNTIDSSIEWYAQFCPIYETIKGKKVYSKVDIRLSLHKGDYVTVKVRYDGDKWHTVKTIVGELDGVVGVTVPNQRCDKFEIRLEGQGTCVIEEIARKYTVGGRE